MSYTSNYNNPKYNNWNKLHDCSLPQVQAAFFIPGFFSECANRSTQRENESAIYQQASPFGDKRQLVRGNPPETPKRKDYIMTEKRNIEIKVRLNRKEADQLCKRVKRSRLSREAYLRHLINDMVPQEAPPPDYYAMMQQLYRIGNGLNQIAQKAHTLNVIDVQRYDAAYRQFETAVKEITEAVVQPKPMGQ